MSIDGFYTELIMFHNRSGHNKRALAAPDYVERGHNPSCGDDLTLQLRVTEGLISEAAFIGSGCAISQASMSIMIDLVTHKSLEVAQDLVKTYLSMIRGETLSEDALDALQDAQVFSGLAKMPARVKCGTLGWHCLGVIIDNMDK